MRPRTKLQKLVYSLHLQLPEITEKQKQYAYKHCFFHYGIVMRKTIFCLECCHEWKDNNLVDRWYKWKSKYQNKPYKEAEKKDPFKCKCPNCNKKIEISRYYNNGIYDNDYFQIITTIKDFQVFRIFHVAKNMKKRTQPHYWYNEVVQHWIGSNGSYTVIAVNGSDSYGYYGPTWYGELSIKDATLGHKYDILPYKTYPYKKYISALSNMKFNGEMFKIPEHSFISGWLYSPILETLIKTNRTSFIKYYIRDIKTFINLWPSIKICWRNKYEITDFGLWLDYLKLLKQFNKDIRSPKYICPNNLTKEHNKYVQKRRQIQRKIELEKTRLKMVDDQKIYEIDKGVFFGLIFRKGPITIEVFKSVQQVMEEGDLLNHCVFTNEYHNKKRSLLMSARVNNKVTETIEIHLDRLEINQSRGFENKPSKHHKEIVDLVNKNLHKIRKCLAKKRKTKTLVA